MTIQQVNEKAREMVELLNRYNVPSAEQFVFDYLYEVYEIGMNDGEVKGASSIMHMIQEKYPRA